MKTEETLKKLGNAMPALKKVKPPVPKSGSNSRSMPKAGMSALHQTKAYHLRPFDRPLSKIIDYDQF